MAYFEAKLHPIRFRLGLPRSLARFKDLLLRLREGREGRGYRRRKGGEERERSEG